MKTSSRLVFRLHTAFKLTVDYTGKGIEAKSLVIKEKKTVVVCKKRAFATRFGPLTSASDGGFQPRRSAVIFAPRRGGVDEKRSSLQGKRYKSGFRVPRKSQMYHAWQKMKDAVLYRKFRFPNQTGPLFLLGGRWIGVSVGVVRAIPCHATLPRSQAQDAPIAKIRSPCQAMPRLIFMLPS